MKNHKILLITVFTFFLAVSNATCFSHPVFDVRAGLAALESGDLDKAESMLQKARFEDPDSYIINYNLGIISYRKRDYDKSAKFFARALESVKTPDERFNAFYNMGNAAFKGFDYSLAITAYKNALSVKNDYQADYNLKVAEKKLQELLDKMKKEQEEQQQQQQNNQDQQQNQQQQKQDKKDSDANKDNKSDNNNQNKDSKDQNNTEDKSSSQNDSSQNQDSDDNKDSSLKNEGNSNGQRNNEEHSYDENQKNSEENNSDNQENNSANSKEQQESEKENEQQKSMNSSENKDSESEKDLNSSESNKDEQNESENKKDEANQQSNNESGEEKDKKDEIMNEETVAPEADRRDVKMAEDKGKVSRPEASQKARAMKNIRLDKKEIEEYLKKMEQREGEYQRRFRINNIEEKDPAYMDQDELREWLKVRNKKKERARTNQQDW